MGFVIKHGLIGRDDEEALKDKGNDKPDEKKPDDKKPDEKKGKTS